MLNHCERPLSVSVLRQTILRAKALELETIVCADSIAEARAIAELGPDIIVAEPTELIGTGQASSMDYVRASIEAVKSVNPDILVLQGAGISNGKDVYNVIHAGAEATGSSSGIVKAPSPAAMVAGSLAKSSSHSRKVSTALILQNFPSRPVLSASMMQPPVRPQR